MEAADFSGVKCHLLLSRFIEITFQRELHVHFFQHLGRQARQWLLRFPVLANTRRLLPGFVSPRMILHRGNSRRRLNQKQFKSKNGQIWMSFLKLVQRPLTSLKAGTLLRGKTLYPQTTTPLPLAMQDWRLNTEKKMHGPECIAWRSPAFVSRIRKMDSEPKKIPKGQLIFIIPTWFIYSNNRQHLSIFIKDEHAARGLTFI